MKIESAVYRVIYKCLCDELVKKIPKGNPPKFKSINRAELFEMTIGGKKIGVRLLHESNISDLKYIYRRFTELSIDTIRGEINPHVLYNILNELGYDLDTKYTEPKSNRDESIPLLKAQNLLDQFISTHHTDIREEQNKVNPVYYIDQPGDRNTNHSIKSITEDFEIISFKNDELQKNKVCIEVKGLLSSFYDAIRQMEYKQAWDLLSNDGKSKSWKGEYKTFKNYFSIERKHFSAINLRDFIQIDNSILECEVIWSFEDEIPATELDSLKELTIAEIDLFTSKAVSFSDRMNKIAGSNTHMIKLEALFRRTAFNDIIKEFPPKTVKQHFAALTTATTKIRFWGSELCICKYKNGEWLISHIRETSHGNNQTISDSLELGYRIV